MSTILTAAREIAATESALDAEAKIAARDYVVQIAAREILGKSEKHDAGNLVDALADAEMTEADYVAMLEAIPRAAELEARIQHCRAAAKDTAAARENLAVVKLEAKEAIRTAERRLSRADNGSRLSSIDSSKRALHARFPYLFESTGSHGTARPLPLLPDAIESELAQLRQDDQERDARRQRETEERIAAMLSRRAGVAPAQPSAKPKEAASSAIETVLKSVSKKPRKASQDDASELPSITGD